MKVSGGKLRLLYVLDILKKYSDEEHPVSSSDIIEKLDAYGIKSDRKALYDDISVLSSYGYDIIYTRTPKNGYFLGERELEFTELSLLADAVVSADFITAKKTADLTKKLSGFLSEHQRKTFSGRIFTEKRAKSDNEELYYTVDKLLRAIDERKMVALTYNKRTFENGKAKLVAKQHIISPYALCWVDDHYYLIGNNARYDNLLHLRIDRINKVEILKENYRPFSQVSPYTDYFDVADYTSKVFNMYGGEQSKAELICDNNLLEQVIDRFGDTPTILPYDENRFLLVVDTMISNGLIAWIMQFSGGITVKAPQNLKDDVVNAAQSIIKSHNA